MWTTIVRSFTCLSGNNYTYSHVSKTLSKSLWLFLFRYLGSEMLSFLIMDGGEEGVCTWIEAWGSISYCIYWCEVRSCLLLYGEQKIQLRPTYPRGLWSDWFIELVLLFYICHANSVLASMEKSVCPFICLTVSRL